MLSSLVGPEPIGYYAAADILFGSLLFLPMVVTTALFPAMAEMHARQPDEVINVVRRVFGPITMMATLIGVGTIVVSSSFVRFLYGEKYAPSGEVLGVFGVVVILTSVSVLLGRLAQATNRACSRVPTARCSSSSSATRCTRTSATRWSRCRRAPEAADRCARAS